MKRPRNFLTMWVLEGTESNPGKFEGVIDIVCERISSIYHVKLVAAIMRNI